MATLPRLRAMLPMTTRIWTNGEWVAMVIEECCRQLSMRNFISIEVVNCESSASSIQAAYTTRDKPTSDSYGTASIITSFRSSIKFAHLSNIKPWDKTLTPYIQEFYFYYKQPKCVGQERKFLNHACRVSHDYRTTCIIGRISTERVYYRKWAGPSVDTTDPSHFELKVW